MWARKKKTLIHFAVARIPLQLKHIKQSVIQLAEADNSGINFNMNSLAW